ncbi:MAG: acyl-CoA synthetase [Kordiimonadaceae bacterium]|nr:acyl-CoA synthetase [Kordiimonadaceae bacterium]
MAASLLKLRTGKSSKAAYIMSGANHTIQTGDLESRSIQLAHLFQEYGLGYGDHIAILMENNAYFLEACLAAQRSGLYYTPVNWHLTAQEAKYIINDCGATVLVTSNHLSHLADSLMSETPTVEHRLMTGGATKGHLDYDQEISRFPTQPFENELEGSYMFYSSGTTGHPKGIKRSLAKIPYGTPSRTDIRQRDHYAFDAHSVYLSPAPLYHAAPLGWSLSTIRLGGTAVIMEQFDALTMLELIEKHQVTHIQCVPTMFVRLLKLTDEERARFDLSSLKAIIHAAAPCPIDVKQQMIDWLGPILSEFYAGSEGNGFVALTSAEWLTHKGSVGKSIFGDVYIVDDAGTPLPQGKVGHIYFSGSPPFEYHNDPEKTKEVFNDKGWSTLGDMGYLDADGYLYLTGRKAHMIISGGVNIYPQEIENTLVMHPDVLDVAVIGIPNLEFGEEVTAIVQPANPNAAGPALAKSLIDFCHQNFAKFKCPRTINFIETLPRMPNGKLRKHLLRKQYTETH